MSPLVPRTERHLLALNKSFYTIHLVSMFKVLLEQLVLLIQQRGF